MVALARWLDSTLRFVDISGSLFSTRSLLLDVFASLCRSAAESEAHTA
jgi:hypothetical protein